MKIKRKCNPSERSMPSPEIQDKGPIQEKEENEKKKREAYESMAHQSMIQI